MGANPSKSAPPYYGRPAVDYYGRPLGPVGPPNFGPGYAFPNGQYPPGFAPSYGPPPPQFMLAPQDTPRRRRKSRKTSSGGSRRRSDRDQRACHDYLTIVFDPYISMAKPDMSMPVPNLATPGGGARSHTPNAPVVPVSTPHQTPAPTPSPAHGRSSIRRAQTPFQRARVVDEDEEEDASNSAPVLPHAPAQSNARGRSPIYAEPQNPPLHRTPSRGLPQPLYQSQQAQAVISDPDVIRALNPLGDAHPGVFGPPNPRSNAPLRNPLPPPPRDLYESSPYKSLLTLPQTAALLTTEFTTKLKEEKKPRKGLFRAFSSRKREKEEAKDSGLHVFPIVINNPPASHNNMPPMPPIPPLHQGGVPGPSSSHSRVPAHFPNDPEAIRYNEDTDYSSFMNHSPHRIFYNDKEWPTATHLVEAQKYLPSHPQIAEEIRLCGDIAHVYPISANYQQYQNPTWSQNHLEVVRPCLVPHSDGRNALTSLLSVP
jgi:hypothetical protein